ncbi:helix-turn-helix transcriptional regulator [Microbacterium lacus]|uniref:helix-turn-helix transcriptional regulator n=1 Tax=Microbacterium lacus TaxID=415217 RepID=UPI000C2BAC30
MRSAIEIAARDEGWLAAADVFQRHWDLYATACSTTERHANLDALTRRERELLVLIADGQPFADIADTLFISLNTVKPSPAASIASSAFTVAPRPPPSPASSKQHNNSAPEPHPQGEFESLRG